MVESKIEMQELLERAAKLCIRAHFGQRDKTGCAYFQHPMRVAMRCSKDEEKIVALLHDVMEDTGITEQELLGLGFPRDIVTAVISVTKREGESYEDFVARAKLNTIGRIVKLRDLEDNLDILRLSEINEDMRLRYNKYLAARRFLLAP